MNIGAAQIGEAARLAGSAAGIEARAGGDRALFSDALAKARGAERGTAGEARDAAEQLVAASLILPVLKGLREGNQAAAPFAPGPGEKAFRGMMDDMLAQKLVKRSNWVLVDKVAERIVRRAGVTP